MLSPKTDNSKEQAAPDLKSPHTEEYLRRLQQFYQNMQKYYHKKYIHLLLIVDEEAGEIGLLNYLLKYEHDSES